MTRAPAAGGQGGPVYVGVDVGGSKIRALAVSPAGRVVAHAGAHAHRAKGPEEVIDRIESLVRSIAGGRMDRIRAVGVGIAAQVDAARGMVLHAGNLRWGRVRLGSRLGRRLPGVPIVVINDAQAAAYGEWKAGAGRRHRDLFVLSLGTGVGAGVILHGRLVEGAHGSFGEIGHTPIVSGGRRCTCGHRGCLEAYVGGWAIAQRARELPARLPGRETGGERGGRSPAGPRTAREVFGAHRAGDPAARKIVREALRYLGDGLVGIANAFDPGRIVLVGGWAAGLPEAPASLRRAIRRGAQAHASHTEVVAGALGEDAAALGAALYARDHRTRRTDPLRASRRLSPVRAAARPKRGSRAQSAGDRLPRGSTWSSCS
ncbi:MAG: ROK family protein [Thermoplasmata archaeon]